MNDTFLDFMPMKDANVFFCFPDFSGGGAEKVMISLLKSFSGKHHTYCLVKSKNGPLIAELTQKCSLIDMNSQTAVGSIMPLARALAKYRPKVLLTTMAYFNFCVMIAIWISGHRPNKIVLREANEPASTLASLPANWIGRLLYYVLYNRADLIVCNAKKVCQQLTKLGVRADKIIIIKNPIDIATIQKMANKTINLPKFDRPSLPLFVSVGRLTKQKGMDLIIDRMAIMQQPSNLLIIGSGPCLGKLQKLISRRKLEGRVVILDFQNNPFPFVAKADAFLLGSRWEGLPNAALEALGLGKTVITTQNCGGLTEIDELKRRKKIIICRSARSFAKEMDEVVKAKNLFQSASNTILESCLPKDFHFDEVIRRYEQALFIQ